MICGQIQVEFELEAGGHDASELAVVKLDVSEELSKLFSVEVELVAREGVSVDPAPLVGQDAVVTVHLGAGAERFFHGVVARIDRWDSGTEPNRNRYVVRIVPRLWKLGHRRHCRIFQGKSTPDIVQQVLKEGQVDVRLALSESYAVREYCVQYRESDLDFVSRLLEEEGIFYAFEHRKDGHTLVLRDAVSSSPDLVDGKQIPFRDRAGMATEEHVDSFLAQREVRSTAVALRDFNYLTPGVDLTSAVQEGGTDMEVYDYPGRYQDSSTGGSFSQIRLEELRVQAETASGKSNSRRLMPGSVFELVEHPGDEFDGEYLLVSVHHHGWNPEIVDLPQEAGQERRSYSNDFHCLRKGIPFRPERRSPRPLIPGPQTAMVVGPSTEEIFTDEHGRIKVQFHWDREGKKDDKSSCWIRVSQAWAGPGWGALYLPRIGHEVVVEFLEGDPDRPMVTGSVYNGQSPPPITLPADKTKSTLRSASSPGSAGSNELRFEDASGSEEIFLHAEKDLDIVVENDKSQRVGGKETLTVHGARSREVRGNQSLLVKLDDTSTIRQNQSLQVSLNRTTTVTGNHTETVLGNQSTKVGVNSSLTVGAASVETVALAKALNVGGAYAVNVGAVMNELVGGLKSEVVGGAKVEAIGGAKTETVAGNRSLRVDGELTETVAKSRTLNVGKELVLNVAGTVEHTTTKTYKVKAKEIIISAADKFVFKVGKGSIEIKSSGEVLINGSKVMVSASGDLTLKAPKITQN